MLLVNDRIRHAYSKRLLPIVFDSAEMPNALSDFRHDATVSLLRIRVEASVGSPISTHTFNALLTSCSIFRRLGLYMLSPLRSALSLLL